MLARRTTTVLSMVVLGLAAPAAAATDATTAVPAVASRAEAAMIESEAGSIDAEAASGTTRQSPCPAGYVSLTFDDGPDVHTDEILDVLAAHAVPAVFFVEGAKVQERPQLVRRAADAGHQVANHTFHHERLTSLNDDEIRWTVTATDDAIRDAGVVPLPLLRPTFGDSDARVQAAVESVGYRTILWDLDSRDWESTATEIERRVLSDLQGGDVVLFHDGSSNTPETIAALPGIIEEARAQGFCFGLTDRDGLTRPGGFQDVEGREHLHAIANLRAAGITDGCNPVGDRFCAADDVRRDQMASFLARALGLDAAGSPPFPDLDAGDEHADGVAAVASDGIAEGYEDGTYRPAASITRAQMAAFLARAYGLEASGGAPFGDVPADHAHAEAIAAVAEAGIAEGYPNGDYRPHAPVIRGHMAAFLDRAGATG
ncbi:polysaccharide deacetylase family protein [Egicoccus sp. AB-alg2]|uniref:polysaccharide deacetylase family protein n=1 Tax=Egicoccus sp. AB-alg2 TaxID=3242693 RepID=UPI00359E5EFC